MITSTVTHLAVPYGASSDLPHALVSAVVVGALLAGVSALSVAVRKRKVARAEAAASAPVEDRSQTLLRQAQWHDQSRDQLATQGRAEEALTHARSAADQWRELTRVRPGRFQAELQAALRRLGELLAAAGQPDEAARVQHEAAGIA
ncbi:hypothetical protein ACFWY9_03245 [Amycolatopsis sp. NPDC059027]|uniref:hypothetical protein n=1 Tax=unclassified Amycolatopsis TaxID=2618356 RepID=UPI003670F11B